MVLENAKFLKAHCKRAWRRQDIKLQTLEAVPSRFLLRDPTPHLSILRQYERMVSVEVNAIVNVALFLVCLLEDACVDG